MEFRTKVSLKTSDHQISHASGIFLMGSCFVENIGNKLEYFKFKTCQNPFGIIFHPRPMLNLFQRLAHNNNFQQEDLRHFRESWLSLETHSSMNANTSEKTLEKLNNAFQIGRNSLQHADYVIISLGTAWYYKNNDTGKVVANCHKIPQKEFSKELSSPQEIISLLSELRKTIDLINKDIKVIFTVSPVRHLKDGFVENQQSKANLVSGLHDFLKKEKNSFYFPSYEIMLDELRDYRFYGRDMLHPNEVAVDYIWKQLSENWMSEKTQRLNLKIDGIQKGIAHRSRAENSEEHKKFLTKLQAKIEEIHKTNPEITFS